MAENQTVTELQEALFQSIDTIASARISELPFDKTILCTIVDASNASNGVYRVTDGSITFEAYSEKDNYKEEYQVYVQIPQNDMNAKKTIISRYMSDANGAIAFVAPDATLADAGPNLLLLSEEYENTILKLKANSVQTTTEPIIINKLPDNIQYNAIKIQADFQTLLSQYEMRSGGYGLMIGLYEEGNDNPIYSFALDSEEDMFGNPWNYNFYTTQKQVYALGNDRTKDITSMEVYFYQRSDFTYYDNGIKSIEPTEVYDLFVKNIEICFAYDVTQVEDNTVKIFTNDSLSYQEPKTNEDDLYRRFKMIFYNKDENNKFVGFDDGEFGNDTYAKTNKYTEDTKKLKDCERYIDTFSSSTVYEDVKDNAKLNISKWPEFENIDIDDISDKELVTKLEQIQSDLNKVLLKTYYAITWERQNSNGTWSEQMPIKFLDPEEDTANEKYRPYSESEFNKDDWLQPTLVLERNRAGQSFRGIVWRNGTPFYSGIIEFTGSLASDNSSARYNITPKITHANAFSKDSYNLYGPAGNLLNTAEASFTRTIQFDYDWNDIASQGTEIDFTNWTFNWDIPTELTMIRLPQFMTQLNQYQFNYNISANYNPSWKNNTITCTAIDDYGSKYIASFTPIFSTFSNSGTDYSLIISEINNKPAYTKGEGHDGGAVKLLVDEYFSYEKDKWDCDGKLSFFISSNTMNVGKDGEKTLLKYIDDEDNPIIDKSKRIGFWIEGRPEDIIFANSAIVKYRCKDNKTYFDISKTTTFEILTNKAIRMSIPYICNSTTDLDFVHFYEKTNMYILEYYGKDIDEKTSIGLSIETEEAEDNYIQYKKSIDDNIWESIKEEKKGIISITLNETQKKIVLKELTYTSSDNNLYKLQSNLYDKDGNNPLDKDEVIQPTIYIIGENTSTISNNTYNIAEATTTVKWQGKNINLKSIYPIPWRSNEQYFAETPSIIIYNSNGVNPQYHSSPCKLYKYNKDDKDDKYKYTLIDDEIIWSLSSATSDHAWMADLTFDNQNTLIVPSMITQQMIYGNSESDILLQAKISDEIVWSQPLVFLQDQWPSSLLNKWDGNLTIETDKNYILSAMMGAGTKDNNNAFTGVIMGDMGKLDSNYDSQIHGLYGFSKGAETFGFNTNGSAFIGKSGLGRIYINPTGNEATIASSSFINTTNNSLKEFDNVNQGSMWNLTSGDFYLKKNSNEYLKFDSNEGLAIRPGAFALQAEHSNNKVILSTTPSETDDYYFYVGQSSTSNPHISFNSSGRLDIVADSLTITGTPPWGNSDNNINQNLLKNASKYIKDSPYELTGNRTDTLDVTDMIASINENKTYTLTVTADKEWAKSHGTETNTEDGKAAIYLYFNNDGSKNYVNAVWVGNGNSIISNGQCKYSFTNNFNGVYYKYVRIRVNTYSDGSNNKTVNFWNFKLEEGTVATPWVSDLNFDNTQGIFLENGNLNINANRITTGTIKSNNYSTGNKTGMQIELSNGKISTGSDNFSVDSDGRITATSGQIAEWILESNRLYKLGLGASLGDFDKDGSFLIQASGTSPSISYGGSATKNNWRLAIGTYFGVDSNGNLYCSSGSFKGTINAGTVFGSSGLLKMDTWDTSGNARIVTKNEEVGISFDNNNSNMIIFAKNNMQIGQPSSGRTRISINNSTGSFQGTWNFTTSTSTDSDINLKNSIEPLNEKYSVLFDNLIPVRYKYNNGTSNRYHTGLIAQNLQKAIYDAGLTEQDCAALCTIENSNMSIRYEELISLCINEIQHLKLQVKELTEGDNGV